MSQGDQIQTISAGGTIPIGSTGTLFAVKSSSTSDPIDLIVDGAARRLEIGDVTNVPRDARLIVRNTNEGASVQVRFYHGDDQYRAARVAGTVSVSNFGSSVVTGSGDVNIPDAQTDTIAENVDRNELTLQASPDNTGTLRIRDSAGNAFAWIQAGGSITVPTTAEIQVRNDTGSPQDYAYSETE